MKEKQKLNQELVLKLNKEGWNTAVISEKTGSCQSAVEKFLKKKGLPTSPIKFRGRISWKDVETIVDLYDNHRKTAKAILKETGLKITENSVIKLVKLYGKGDIRPVGTYPNTLNEKYFDKIDSPIKAYFLGYIYADGCVLNGRHDKKYFTFEIHEKDECILQKLKSELCYTGKIHHRKNRNHIFLSIRSDKLCDSFGKYGIIPRKTWLSAWDYRKIPNKYQFDYLRGLIDGDGTVTKDGRVSIIGNEKTIRNVGDFLSKLDICFKIFLKKQPEKYMPLYTLSITRRDEAMKVYKLIWDNNEFCLKRKKDRIESQYRANVNRKKNT